MNKTNKRRADGRIAVQIYLGKDKDGKRKYKTVYGKTQAEADEKANQLKELLHQEINFDLFATTFEEWGKKYLHSKTADVSTAQMNNYTSLLNRINPYIGSMAIGSIKLQHLQPIIDDLAEENPKTKLPTSKKTLNDVKKTIAAVFDYAMLYKAVADNPARAIKIPKKAPERKRRALTNQERDKIFNTPHEMRAFAMLLLFAGLRIGEALPLTWNDIDLKSNIIDITKTVEFFGGSALVKDGGKTENSIRKVYIPQILVDLLADEKQRALTKEVPSLLLFPSENGKLLTKYHLYKKWDEYIEILDIPAEITPHCLRHTYASLLFLSGIDALTAKEQLGHAKIETTLGIYTHLEKEHKVRSMAKLDDLISSSM